MIDFTSLENIKSIHECRDLTELLAPEDDFEKDVRQKSFNKKLGDKTWSVDFLTGNFPLEIF